jgi:dihydrofolate synthase/folylpolyglutamate synthase
LFPKEAIYYFCKPNIPRGLDAVVLQKKATEFNLKGNVYNSVTTAYETAANNAANDDFIYIGGSTFVVAEAPLNKGL